MRLLRRFWRRCMRGTRTTTRTRPLPTSSSTLSHSICRCTRRTPLPCSGRNSPSRQVAVLPHLSCTLGASQPVQRVECSLTHVCTHSSAAGGSTVRDVTSGVPVDVALKWSSAGALDDFFDRIASWLIAYGDSHSAYAERAPPSDVPSKPSAPGGEQAAAWAQDAMEGVPNCGVPCWRRCAVKCAPIT